MSYFKTFENTFWKYNIIMYNDNHKIIKIEKIEFLF